MTPLQQASVDTVDRHKVICQRCMEDEPMLCEGEQPIIDGSSLAWIPCLKRLKALSDANKARRAREAGVDLRVLQIVAQAQVEPIHNTEPCFDWPTSRISHRAIATIGECLDRGESCRYVNAARLYQQSPDEQREWLSDAHDLGFLFVDRVDAPGGTHEARGIMLGLLQHRASQFMRVGVTLGRESKARNAEEDEFFGEIRETWSRIERS